MFCDPVPAKVPEAAKVTPLTVVEIEYVPAVVTVAVMVWVTPDTAVPAVSVPAEAVEQEKAETTADPFEEGNTVVLLKLQFGVVFNVKLLAPADAGVPVAVSTMSCVPVLA
jgi:hypothetical protein